MFQIINIGIAHNICMVAVENIIHLIAENIIQVQLKSTFLLKKAVILKGPVLTGPHTIGRARILLKATEDSIIVPVAPDSTGSLNFIIIFLLSTEAKRQEKSIQCIKLVLPPQICCNINVLLSADKILGNPIYKMKSYRMMNVWDDCVCCFLGIGTGKGRQGRAIRFTNLMN